MEILKETADAKGTKFFIKENDKEIARGYLYLMQNALHKKPFGFIEDIYTEENRRGSGAGTKILEKIILEAKKAGCYKLICTSRHEREKVHEWYEKHGFKNRGIEFRMDFEE